MISVKTALPLLAARSALVCAALLSCLAQAQDAPQARLPTVQLTAGMHVIQAELAVSPLQQQVGMMFRRTMGANEGMLFVNQHREVRCFWMRNTLLPLSIAFIADDGTIINVAEMKPQSDQSHCSTKPVRYALEMNAGWFGKRGFKAGSKLRGAPFDP
ncbi:MAG: hypothetical protein C0505_18010 [Leptothrix sp. (in: Bacteria)]|nr:hypothetical protein [Leptothrix sp. (in: b-proteobacteria)]